MLQYGLFSLFADWLRTVYIVTDGYFISVYIRVNPWQKIINISYNNSYYKELPPMAEKQNSSGNSPDFEPDFTIEAVPNTQTLYQGESTSYKISAW